MSEIIVQKFGGTSVGSVDRIDAVAEIIKKASKRNKIIVVVSAMSGETNKLVNLANHFGENPDRREFDALVSTCLLYTSPSPRDGLLSRMPSSA